MKPGHLAVVAVREPKLDLVSRRLIGFGLTIMSALVAWAGGFRGEALAQMGRNMMGGQGMMGDGCDMCGQSWRNVPDKLPSPESQAWLKDLKYILSLKRLSLVQYRADETNTRSTCHK